MQYQKLALSVRKKIMVSLMYPAVLLVLVVGAGRLSDHLRRPALRRPLRLHQRQASAADADSCIATRHRPLESTVLFVAAPSGGAGWPDCGFVPGRHLKTGQALVGSREDDAARC
ncbi:MAG: hypothetical protein MZV70_19355 [Desulfobacterales bacterium]|nr:hypothetical protein [Desulfobacterales bacterium]